VPNSRRRAGGGLLCAAVVAADIDALERLSPGERGAVLGLALGGVRGVDALQGTQRIAGAVGATCRAALQALAALGRDQRARRLAAWAREAREPVPAGIARVHPGWLRAVLEREATPILLAVVVGLPAEVRAVAAEIVAARDDGPSLRAPAAVDPEALAELRRAVFAAIAPMPDAPAVARSGDAAPPPWTRFLSLSMPALAAELARRGAEVLGASLQGAPAEAVAHAAGRLGAGLGAVVQAAAARPLVAAERQEARDLVAAAAAPLPSPSPAPSDDRPLPAAEAIGIEALAGALTGAPAEVARAVAQRLPPALGRALLRVRDRGR